MNMRERNPKNSSFFNQGNKTRSERRERADLGTGVSVREEYECAATRLETAKVHDFGRRVIARNRLTFFRNNDIRGPCSEPSVSSLKLVEERAPTKEEFRFHEAARTGKFQQFQAQQFVIIEKILGSERSSWNNYFSTPIFSRNAPFSFIFPSLFKIFVLFNLSAFFRSGFPLVSELVSFSKNRSAIMTRGNQRERDRERAQSRSGAKGKQKADGLTPEQRRERDAKALQEKAAKKAAQDAGGNNAGGSKK
ncbi:uncharacterized protein LOC106758780 [Vigna radiata var. radiata]|uniref:Uncharacterized protein LOC106758780 n=1 Tax=Vigna radiata var. radiata TaxID=3916 RepID=A0A1S3TU26_VIGRR|nr:uncharacterized protein LOC106758780 [Vigna radiata var. radiata]